MGLKKGAYQETKREKWEFQRNGSLRTGDYKYTKTLRTGRKLPTIDSTNAAPKDVAESRKRFATVVDDIIHSR